MFNQLRADLYRQLRSKGLYILGILVILYPALTVKFEQPGGVTMTPEIVDKLSFLVNHSWTHLMAVKGLTLGISLLLYFYITIFVIIFGTEFTNKTYKSSLTSGISRGGFLTAKYLVMLLDIFVFNLIYFGAGVLTNIILGRQLGTTWSTLTTTVLKTSLLSAFFISVIFGLSTILLLLTDSITVSAVFIVVFSVIVSLLHTFLKWNWLKYLDFFGSAAKFTFKQINTSDLLPYLGAGILGIILSFIVSYILLSKKEL